MNPGTQTSTSTQTPPGYQKNIYKSAAKDALRFYKGGAGLNTGSMVVPYSKQSTGAFSDLMDMSAANSDGQGLSGQMQDIIGGGGFNNQQRGVLADWRAQLDTPYDMNEDSQGVLKSLQRDIQDSVNLNAAAGGRYASGLHQGRMAQDIGDATSEFRMKDYQNDLARKDAIRSNTFNAAQAGLGNMSAAYQGMQAPQQTALSVGTAEEDLKRRTMDDRARRQNLPWEHLQKLLAAGGGMGSYGTTTTQAPGQNPILAALGAAGTVGNFAFGSNPMATGGILGAFQ